ncbi:MAG: ZIP family metal transporter [Reichenbachiella sp.]
MIQSVIILFLSALLGGLLAIKSIDIVFQNVKYLLVFAGSFLFSITILHILPELFESGANYSFIALAILIGFFFQQFLEYFTNGVEHGHMHIHQHENSHTSISGITLMIALCFHGFLEGTLLAHPDTIHVNDSEGSLLAGIVLHKIPAALALISVLSCYFKSKKTQIILLIVFALASPLGIISGQYIGQYGLLDMEGMVLLFAFVAGNFLHISTTIFIESSPEHSWNTKKMIVSGIAAVIAVLTELVF